MTEDIATFLFYICLFYEVYESAVWTYQSNCAFLKESWMLDNNVFSVTCILYTISAYDTSLNVSNIHIKHNTNLQTVILTETKRLVD